MTSLLPLLLTLGPEGSMPLAIPGAEALLLDPLPGQASPRIASPSELENGYETLRSLLQTLPDAQPIILFGHGAYGTLAVHVLGKTDRFSAAVITCRDYLIHKIGNGTIISELLRHLTPIRPGRKYVRKKRSKRYVPLTNRA